MEHDIVLADEVHQPGLGILPPCLPASELLGLGIAQLFGVTYIADGGIKPHVEHLALSTLHGYGDAPVEVAGDGSGMQATVEPALALPIDIASPFLMILQNPLLQPWLVLVERQVPVLCGTLHQRIARLGIVGIDEFLRAERGTALLALVAIGIRCVASRTLAAYVTIRKEMAGLLVIELLANLLHELALVIEFAEEVACELVVSGTRGAAVDVKRNAEAPETVLDKLVIAVHDLLHSDTLLAGTDGDGHSVLVATADEGYLTPLETQVAHVYVGGHIHPRQVTYMHGAVGIRQSGRDCCSLEVLFHRNFLICAKVLFFPCKSLPCGWNFASWGLPGHLGRHCRRLRATPQ